jgi:negative regulator of genetic competence, sporulation and motility
MSVGLMSRKSFKLSRVAAAALVAAVFSSHAHADVSDADRHEVTYLLEYLRTSGCEMERNGKKHNSENAYAHVKKKYEYFRDKIKTSENFVEYSASKSTMSGKYYHVFCGHEPAERTQDWLLEELRRYRAKNPGWR